MRGLILLLCGLLLWGAGCESTAKVDNPVVGPPPPRLPPEKILERQRALGMLDESTGVARVADNSAGSYSVADVQRVSAQAEEFPDDLVVAKVNEQPVFVAELIRVLDVVGGKGPALHNLELAIAEEPDAYRRSKMSEALNRERKAILQRMLPKVVERKLMVQGYKSGLKKAQLDQIDAFAKKDWESYLLQKQQQFKQASVPELLALWEQLGFDLGLMEQSNSERLIAGLFIQKAQGKALPEPSRQDLLHYYETNREKYKNEGRVRWQQLVVMDARHGGPDGAQKQVDLIVKHLLTGADFTETIKKFGDGVKAKQGGIWEWTKRGSLTEKEVEQQLFELPVGEMSSVIRTQNGFQIVEVLERVEDSYRPFENLQAEITDNIKEDRFNETKDRVIAEMRASSTVWTIFDGTSGPVDDSAPAVTNPESLFEAGVAPSMAPAGLAPITQTAAEDDNPFE